MSYIEVLPMPTRSHHLLLHLFTRVVEPAGGAVLFAPIRSNLRGCGVGSGVAGEQLLRGAGRLVAVGDAAAAAQAVGEAGEDALPCGVVIQGVGQGARPLPHRARP